jgi:hypothetical protein
MALYRSRFRTQSTSRLPFPSSFAIESAGYRKCKFPGTWLLKTAAFNVVYDFGAKKEPITQVNPVERRSAESRDVIVRRARDYK